MQNKTILLFPPNMPIIISSHETETSNFRVAENRKRPFSELQTVNCNFAIPHFGTQPILPIFPILEHNAIHFPNCILERKLFCLFPILEYKTIHFPNCIQHFGTPLILRWLPQLYSILNKHSPEFPCQVYNAKKKDPTNN